MTKNEKLYRLMCGIPEQMTINRIVEVFNGYYDAEEDHYSIRSVIHQLIKKDLVREVKQFTRYNKRRASKFAPNHHDDSDVKVILNLKSTGNIRKDRLIKIARQMRGTGKHHIRAMDLVQDYFHYYPDDERANKGLLRKSILDLCNDGSLHRVAFGIYKLNESDENERT